MTTGAILDEAAGREPTDAVRDHVLRSLGGPATRLLVRVRPLWGNHFRVNVYAGLNGPEATIAHSYFVVTDESGEVLNTVPAIRGPSPTHPRADPRAAGKRCGHDPESHPVRPWTRGLRRHSGPGRGLAFSFTGTPGGAAAVRAAAARDGSEVLATHLRDEATILEFVATREPDVGGKGDRP